MLSVLNVQGEEGCLLSPLWRRFVVHGNKTKREGEQGAQGVGAGGIKGGTDGKGKKKFEPVIDNNAVCFVTET